MSLMGMLEVMSQVSLKLSLPSESAVTHILFSEEHGALFEQLLEDEFVENEQEFESLKRLTNTLMRCVGQIGGRHMKVTSPDLDPRCRLKLIQEVTQTNTLKNRHLHSRNL